MLSLIQHTLQAQFVQTVEYLHKILLAYQVIVSLV
jgi:hypothetical protein